jgi:hypothetical protein
MTGTTLTDPPPLADASAAPIDRARGRRTLLLLALVCVLPVVASYLAYYVWQPGSRVNYGELISPTPLPESALPGSAGLPPLDRHSLSGQWTLLYAGPAACPDACAAALLTMRQARLAQGREMERVGRAWLLTGADASPRATPHLLQGVHTAHAHGPAAEAWLAALPEATAGTHLYLIDPLGNVMMRFPPQADIQRLTKDLQRLLKYSALGR